MPLLAVAYAAAILALIVVLRGERAQREAGFDQAGQLFVSMVLGLLALACLFVVYGVITS